MTAMDVWRMVLLIVICILASSRGANGACSPECVHGICLVNECHCQPGFEGQLCQSPITAGVQHDLKFLYAASQNVIDTPSGNFTVNDGFVLVPGISGKTLRFTAAQFVNITGLKSACLETLDSCANGLTIRFAIIFKSLMSDAMVLQFSGSTGIEIRLVSRKMHFLARTQANEWSMSSQPVQTNVWYNVELGWTYNASLTLSINKGQDVVSSTPKTISATAVTPGSYLIGNANSTNTNSTVLYELEGMIIYENDLAHLRDMNLSTYFPAIVEHRIVVGNNVSFICTVTVAERNVVLSLDWLIGSRVLKSTNTTLSSVTSYLTENELQGATTSMTHGVICQVAACYANLCVNSSLSTLSKTEYRPSITIRKTSQTVMLDEGKGAASFDLSSTLPLRFLCDCSPTDICSVHISVATSSTSKPPLQCRSKTIIPQVVLVTSRSSCVVNMANLYQTISIKAKLDGKFDGSRQGNIRLQAKCFVNNTYGIGRIIGNVPYIVKDMDQASTCKSINDPHITTFDGWTFDNYFEGEFLLYRHTNYPIQVNSFYRACGSATCNCAVAVQSGDDVIVLDRCDDATVGVNLQRHFLVKLYKNGNLSAGTRIKRFDGGLKYEIILPTGMIVTASASYQRLINIWITPSSLDFNNTEGLCGDFDSDPTNDAIMLNGTLATITGRRADSFALSWRVTGRNSLYQGICPDGNLTFPDSQTTYCECIAGQTASCGKHYDALVCPTDTTHGTDITADLIKYTIDRPKCTGTGTGNVFTYNSTLAPIVTTWPTASGQTQVAVTNICVNTINGSTAASQCNLVKGINASTDIANCIEDIKVTDDIQWSNVALASYQELCRLYADRDLGLGPSSAILNTLCVGNCNNGTCVAGACKCKQNFTGGDCQIDLKAVPQITRLGYDGFCELPTCNPKQIHIYGGQFVEKVTVCVSTVYIPSVHSYSRTASFINMNEVVCDISTIPLAPRMTIAASNNESIGSSQSFEWLICNRLCQICDKLNRAVTTKRCNCFINGKCFNNLDVQSNKICYVPISQTQLTKVIDAFMDIYLSFDAIALRTNGTISGKYWAAILEGSVQSVTGINGTGLLLMGDASCINLGKVGADPCVNDLSKCQNGITVSFWSSFNRLKENTYIFSSGGESMYSPGFLMVYKFGRVQISARTVNRAWFTSIDKPQLNTWAEYWISLDIKTGVLEVYVNKSLVAKDTLPNQEVIKNKIVADFKFGCVSTIGWNEALKAVMVVDDIHIWTAGIQLLTNRTILQPLISTTTTTVPPTTTAHCPPGCSGSPTVITNAYLTSKNNGKSIEFTCHMPQVLEPNVRYKVQWMSGSAVLLTSNMAQGATKSIISSDMIIQSKGLTDKLFCRVYASFTGPCSGSAATVNSNQFVAKIKVVTAGTNLVVSECGNMTEIHFSSNAPAAFFCGVAKRNCSIRIRALFVEALYEVKCRNGKKIVQAVIGWDKQNNSNSFCGTEINNVNWNRIHIIYVKAKIDSKLDGTKVRYLDIHRVVVQNMTIIVRESLLRRFQVTIKDCDTADSTCSSVNDPHITTFDRKRYDNFLSGEFVLYKHKTMDFAVHGMYVQCRGGGRRNARATCNCGAAVLSGDDVIVLNKCPRKSSSRGNAWGRYKKINPMTVTIFRNGKLTPGTRIEKMSGGRKYRIYLPTGTYVTVQEHHQYINIWVTASTWDFNQTLGLCGNFDGKSYNDLMFPDGTWLRYNGRRPDAFSDSWRVSRFNTIFFGVAPLSTTVTSPGPLGDNKIWCDCVSRKVGTNTQVCARGLDVERCDQQLQPGGVEVTIQIYIEARLSIKWGNRFRRATNPPTIADEAFAPFADNLNYVAPNASWPTPGGWYKSNATNFCDNYIKTTNMYKSCGAALNQTMFDGDINACVLDIQVSDSTDWANAALEAIAESCITVASKYVIADNATAAAGMVTMPANLILDIQDSTCPSNCSARGNCAQGVCQCDPGFVGEDCSVVLGDPPVLSHMPNGGLCDVRKIVSCKEATIYGQNFATGQNVTCVIQKFDLAANMTTGNTSTTKATFVGPNQVKCPLLSNQPVILAVSNDGAKQSNETVLYLPFDSACFYCNIDPNVKLGSCVRQNLGGSCIINGICYAVGEQNPNNKCLVCTPSSTDTSWTKNINLSGCVTPSPQGGLSDTDIIIICVVIAVFVALLIILVIYIYQRNNRSGQGSKPDEEPKPTVPPVRMISNRPRYSTSSPEYDNPAYDTTSDFERTQRFDQSQLHILEDDDEYQPSVQIANSQDANTRM
ncbi:uncharacterized protein LOC141899868 isoform X2 [Tubulanus polymorphus]|uniref:uncharacterized protein LOC141899868 isoform X2 n=1 Tax=Tubulanus polymorphus TaxID=672921 RepID=UPI003DA2BA88